MSKPGGQGNTNGRGRRAQRLTERSNGDRGSDGPRGQPTPPSSGVGLQNINSNSNSTEGVGVGGQKRTGSGGGDNEKQMWKEVSGKHKQRLIMPTPWSTSSEFLCYRYTSAANSGSQRVKVTVLQYSRVQSGLVPIPSVEGWRDRGVEGCNFKFASGE